MPRPPSYAKQNPSEQPIIYLALTSSTLPLYTVNEYADTMIAQRMSSVSGVSRVQVYGAQKYAVRIQVDPDQLAAHQVGIDDVQRAVQQSNVNLPTGRLRGSKQSFTVQSSGQLTEAAAYRPLIVQWRNGVPLRLEELANVVDSVEDNKTIAWNNGTRGIILAVSRQPGTNTVQIVDNVRKLLPELQAALPPAVKFELLYDASQSVRASIGDVEFTLVSDHCPRRHGHLSLFEKPFCHADSRIGSDSLDHRHFRRDVSVALQPEYAVAHGLDIVCRFCRR